MMRKNELHLLMRPAFYTPRCLEKHVTLYRSALDPSCSSLTDTKFWPVAGPLLRAKFVILSLSGTPSTSSSSSSASAPAP
ncbi:ORF912 [White spot syndrome virus]|uniref:Wsv393 n=3 Tax=White spot syndrome virus TaxID=342409 RepID=Q8VAK9_WSSVS|nr:wsv393 [Shrimp white spot syndrome virus]AFX59770.1 wsv393 [White spot syndrome virus]AAL33395.1 wsv393 [Shrimp white spot syndrome virus]AAL89320.1 WSSV452 [Shrimp white spot syndrome virus]ATU83851.1 ORF912 [White spot syndrome virus]AWQ60518.1 wsv393 [Shrimp white spot syndrome virus]